MSIQRWDVQYTACMDDEGDFVIYADHVIAMDVACQKARTDERARIRRAVTALVEGAQSTAYEAGVSDERKRVASRSQSDGPSAVPVTGPVDADLHGNYQAGVYFGQRDALAAIAARVKALRVIETDDDAAMTMRAFRESDVLAVFDKEKADE